MNKIGKVLVEGFEWTPTKHTECNLGKWYYSEGKEFIKRFGHKALELFNLLESAHEKLHNFGINTVKYHKENNLDRSLFEMTEMYKCSQEVVEILSRLQEIILNEKS